MNASLPVDIFHSMLWLDSKDSRYRNFNLVNSHTLSPISCWKIRFKNQVTSCSHFPSEAMLRIKEVEMVDLVDELKILSISLWKKFSKF